LLYITINYWILTFDVNHSYSPQK